MKKIIINVLTVLSAIVGAQAAEYEYEFGSNVGEIAYTTSGRIDLTWNTEVEIPVTVAKEIVYVKVVVNSLSPPKVDYDSTSRTVRIAYSWTQIPASSYQIWAKSMY